MKNFCISKDTIKKMKRQATEYEKKYLQSTYLIKDSYPEYPVSPLFNFILEALFNATKQRNKRHKY